ncbi:hypothetical protein OG394_17935 [Kribbella sp. NBC_01245]|uniref:hypothetical protein n=1 Tax=Kribbella sp. NBC_01245 TaxID=2903578 RepID=UPI002E2BA4A2|nr:hypothetical protein [Kribbella sp. NBC_01245]
MHWALWVASGLVGLFLLDRLLLWVEGKGWLYYRKRRPERGAHGVGLAFLEMYQGYDDNRRIANEQRVKDATIRQTKRASPPIDLDT